MVALPEKQHATLMANPWFAQLAPGVREDVLARTTQRQLPPGACLFHRGDPYDGFYGILEGSIRIGGIARSGQEAILTFYEPGSWFGEISAFDGLPRTHDAYAHKATTLLCISPEDFEDLLSRHPVLPRLFLRLECKRLRLLAAVFEDYSTQSMEGRLAGRLLVLAHAFGSASPQGAIELHLPQETLAQLIGATRQRVNQMLRDWVREGLVAHRYGRLSLLDEAGLEELARK